MHISDKQKQKGRWFVRLVAANPDGHRSSASAESAIELPLRTLKSHMSNNGASVIDATNDIMVGDTITFGEDVTGTEYAMALTNACKVNVGTSGFVLSTCS